MRTQVGFLWPPSFTPDFEMDRDRTLVLGPDHRNHPHIDTAMW